MILVITHQEKINGHLRTMVSHGIHLDTGNHVVLETAPVSSESYRGIIRFDQIMGEYVIDN